nr:integrase, catalytic region, zinc finger, CCHC-type, peptidase aspartic, catalytic [Tanacetum cinerariifolium]
LFQAYDREFELLINFVWQFLGTVRFGNDHVAAILDLEVAFRRNTYFVRNLDGVYLVKGNHTTNLYTINLHDMASASRICLMARATSTKSWLWHQRFSHLNFDTINDLTKNDLVTSLPKFKYHKEHLCLSCEQGKRKRASHPLKPVPYSKQRSKDEAQGEIKTFLKRITVLLQAPVIIASTTSTTTADSALTPSNSFSQPTRIPSTSQNVDELETQQHGFIDADHPSHVYNLKKAQYGLKQAPKAWYYELLTFLLQNHFFKGTIDSTLFIRHINDDILVDSGFKLIEFSDADYAGCKDTFKSTFGEAQFLGKKMVNWSSKKQDCMGLSAAKAEYMSLSACCAQVL